MRKILYIFLSLAIISTGLVAYFGGGKIPSIQNFSNNGNTNSGIGITEIGNIGKDSDHYTFMVMSDLHFDSHTIPSKVNRLLDSINKINPEFIIITGDVTTADIDGWQLCYDNYMKFRNNVSVPVFAFPGNHDAINRNLDAWLKMTKEPIYYSFDWKGIHFVTLADEYEDSAGTISDEQLQWFQDEIQNNKNRTILVFSHQPLPYTVYGTDKPEEKTNLLENSDKLIDILDNTNDVKLWFSGHQHFDSSFKPSIRETYGTTFVQIGAMLDSRNTRTFEVKVVDVRQNNITVKTLNVYRDMFLDSETYVVNTTTSLNTNSIRGENIKGSNSLGKGLYSYQPFNISSYSFENLSYMNVSNGTLPDGLKFLPSIGDNSTWELSTDNVKDGSHSIKITKYNDINFTSIRTPNNVPIRVIPGKSYSLSAWYLAENVSPTGVGISIVWKDRNGDPLQWSDKKVDSKTVWSKILITATAPEYATTAELRLRVFSKNTVYWDLVEFKKWDYVGIQ